MKGATPMTPPSALTELFFPNVNNIQPMIPDYQKNITTHATDMQIFQKTIIIHIYLNNY